MADPGLINGQYPGDPADWEAAAQQLSSASLTGYGTLPNPQLAYEAMITNSAPAVSQALSTGDPAYNSLVMSSPAGAAPRQSQLAPTPPDPNAAQLFAFDPASYQASLHDQLSDDKNASWRSFGQVPMLNVGWMNTVRKSENPDDIKKWQQLLHDQGFFQDDKFEPNGMWDNQTEAAFNGFMIARALPMALYGRDIAQREQATSFLGTLGFDATALAQHQRDPTFNKQVVQQWMAAQGPDAHFGTRDELNSWVDQFGSDSLPQQYQEFTHEGLIDQIRGGLSIFSGIPVIGGAWSAGVNLGTGNWDLGKLTESPEQQRSEKISAQLSEQDKKALAPAIEDVKNSQGFLGFLDNYEKGVTKSVLAMDYFFMGGLTKGDWQNPFDPTSQVNLWAEKHKDNLMSGLLGDDWAQQNPVWAAVGNFGLGIADDPLTYLPVVTGSKIAQELKGSTRAIRAAVQDPESQKAMDVMLSRHMQTSTAQSAATLARTLADVSDQGHGIGDAIKVLQAGNSRYHMEQVDKILKAADHDAAGRIAQDYQGDRFLNSKTLGAGRAALKNVGPAVDARMDGNLFSRMRAQGGFADSNSSVAFTHAPADAFNKLTEQGVAAGMRGREVDALTRPVWDAYIRGEDLTQFMDVANKAIENKYFETVANRTTFGKAAFASADQARKAFNVWRTKRTDDWDRAGQEAMDHLTHYMPHPEVGADPGELAQTLNPNASPNDVRLLNQLQDEHRANRALIGQYTSNVQSLYGSATLKEAIEQAMKDPAKADLLTPVLDRMGEIRAEINKITRPAPFAPSQLAAEEHFLPFTTHQMVAFRNPALRNLESVQHGLHMDALTGLWKKITLARISTDLRMTIGDDAVRVFGGLMSIGDRKRAFQYAIGQMYRLPALAYGWAVPGFGWGLKRTEKLDEAGNVVGKTLLPRITGREGTIVDAEGTVTGYRKTRAGMIARGNSIIDQNRLGGLTVQLHQLLNQADDHFFMPFNPTDAGYRKNAPWVLGNLLSKNDPMVKEWLKDGRDGIERWVKSDDVQAKQMRQIMENSGGEGALAREVDKRDQILSIVASDKRVRGWMTKGQVDQKQLGKMVNRMAQENIQLPVILGRRNTMEAENFLHGRWGAVETFPNMLYNEIAKPLVTQSRSYGWKSLHDSMVQRLTDYYHKDGEWTAGWGPEKVESEASSRAFDWVKDNTYQGQRSIMGSTLRNVMPFWGACQPLDAKLATPTGWCSMGEVRVGDRVIGGDGAPREVVGVYPQGEREVFRLTMSNGTETECDRSHVWKVTDRKGNHPRLVRLEDILRRGLVYADGVPKWAIPLPGPVAYEPAAPLPLDPYLLGVLLGDGCFRGNLQRGTGGITLAMHKDDVSEMELAFAGSAPDGVVMRTKMEKGLGAKGYLSGRGAPYPNPMSAVIRSLGLFGLLGEDKFIPEQYLRGSVEDRLGLLQGLVDSDGTIVPGKPNGRYFSTSYRLAAEFGELVRSLGGVARVALRGPRPGSRPQWKVCFGRLPAEMIPARLARKVNAWVPSERRRQAFIVKVESVGRKPVQCIQVDDPDGLYLTDDFIVTHNTASMDRFWMGLATKHLGVGHVLATEGLAAEKAAEDPSADMQGFAGILAHLGFTKGTALAFNPSDMFFLSRDGVASFVPGTGMVLAPLWHVVAEHQSLADALSDIPGVGRQIDRATGQAQPMFPFLADLVSGAGTALTGKPFGEGFLTRSQDTINQQVNAKLKQRAAAGEPSDATQIESATREVGREMFTQGALSFLFPVGPHMIDEKSRAIKATLDQWRKAGNDAQKDQLISSQLGVTPEEWQKALAAGSATQLLAKNPESAANLLAYFDRRLSPQERDVIAGVSPWVVPYSTSQFETADKKPISSDQFQEARRNQSVHVISPQEYTSRVKDHWETNRGWLAYNKLVDQRDSWMRQTGITSVTDPEYKKWKASVMDPQVTALEDLYPSWAHQFSQTGKSDLPGLAQGTRTLRTLSTWEVIPQHSDFENHKSVLWRQALHARDQAAGELSQIRSEGGSRSEEANLLQAFKNKLVTLANQNPEFATELNSFSFKQWSDIVNLEAMEAAASGQ